MNRWTSLLIQPAVTYGCRWKKYEWQPKAPRPSRFPLTLLGIAAIIGGIALFNMRTDSPVHVGFHASLDDEGTPAAHFTKFWPGDHEIHIESELHQAPRKWVAITLGAA